MVLLPSCTIHDEWRRHAPDMRSFGSLHEASILSVLCLSKEIGRYLAAISPPSALVARPAKVSHRPASRPAGLSFSLSGRLDLSCWCTKPLMREVRGS